LKKNRKIRAFTLLEVLVSMAVFTVLMLALMQFFGAAQKIWTGTGQKNIMYENARVAMDLMSRDLQCAFYEWDRVPFLYTANDPSTSYDKIAFVTASGRVPNTNCISRLCEMQYYVGTAANLNYLMVTCTGEKTDANLDNTANWDFYRNSGSIGVAAAVFSTADTAQQVIPYVTGLKFSCYDKNMNSLSATPGFFPYSVKIDLTLLDRESYIKWVAMPSGGGDSSSDSSTTKTFRQNNERTFSRMVILGEKGQTAN